jgi:hypothetical protein
MLSSSEATAQLHVPMDPAPAQALAVTLRIAEPHSPVEVWTVGAFVYKVGIIAAPHHSDVVALSAAGLTFSAFTDGYNVTIRAES